MATVAGLCVVAIRARAGTAAETAVNLLGIRWLRRLLTAPAFQLALQLPLFGLMGVVVWLGFFDVQDGGVNLATKLTWTIWWATGAFVLLTWADEQLGVVRSPRITGWIVLFFVALAGAVGLRYERRSFCRYLCPIGGLIGLYSM